MLNCLFENQIHENKLHEILCNFIDEISNSIIQNFIKEH